MAELGSFCTSCGAKLDSTAAFCTKCGTKREVDSQSANIAIASPSVDSPTPVATSAPISTTVPVSTNILEASPPAANPVFSTPAAVEVPSVIALGEKPKGSGSKAIFLIIALMVLLGAAFGGWKYWQKSTRVEIEVSPDTTSIPPGGSTHVAAEVPNPNNVDVIWSVREGSSGGTVTSAGALAERGTVKFVATYNASTTPGTYHVVATLSDNSESTGETTITVGGSQQ